MWCSDASSVNQLHGIGNNFWLLVSLFCQTVTGKKKAIQPNGYVYWQPIWFLISWKQTYPAIRMFPLEITQHCIVWVFYFFGNWSPTCQRRWWWKIFHKVSFSKNPNTQFSQIRKTKFLKSKFQKVTFSNFLCLDFSTF